MKRLSPILLATGLALAGCSSSDHEPDQPDTSASTTSTVTQTKTTPAAPPQDSPKPSIPPNVKTDSERTDARERAGGGAGTAERGRSGSGSASSSPACGNSSADQEIRANLAKIQPTKWDWDPNFAITDGYDPCAALSWSIVTVHSATSSSARQIVLFNRGEYIGTATAEAYGFQPTVTRASDHTINVIYHYPKPGESNIIYTGEAHATFTWNEATQSVDMAGEVPPT